MGVGCGVVRWIACCAAVAGCGPSYLEDTAETDAGDDAAAPTGADGDDADGDDVDGDDAGGDDTGDADDAATPPEPESKEWTALIGPCSEFGTSALWFDGPSIGFAGCGVEPTGLFTTVDGGSTWTANPDFEGVFINDIHRGPDGVLCGTGMSPDGAPIFEIAEGASLTLVPVAPGALPQVVAGDNVAVTADGRMLVDVLAGVTAAYRPSPDEPFVAINFLHDRAIDDIGNALRFQIQSIVTHDNDFYAAGSIVDGSSGVFLPSRRAGATYHLAVAPFLPEVPNETLNDLHVWSSNRILAAGTEWATDTPLVVVADGDPYDAASWTRIALADSGIDMQASIDDLHVVGDTVIAGGQLVPRDDGGFVIISDDGGLTWTDISPTDVGPISAVWLFDDGSALAASGDNELWALR